MNSLMTISIIMMLSVIIMLDIPTVYMTQDYECIRVLNSDNSNGDCNNLPNRYETIYVSFQ